MAVEVDPFKNSIQEVRLFKFKSGSVNAEVWGCRERWAWRKPKATYFRRYVSRKEPGKWKRTSTFLEQHQRDLEKCVAAVGEWYQRNQ